LADLKEQIVGIPRWKIRGIAGLKRFRVQGLGIKDWGLGFRVPGSGFMVYGLWFMVYGLGFRV
jgi:hypothetical protein